MTHRDIRVVGDPVLRTECDPIREITPGVKALIEDLLENVNDEGRAGLAANQIGVASRAFSWNIDGELGYIINPVITYLSEDTQDGDEGCLSVPQLWFPRTRAAEAACEGIDLDGKAVVLEGDGITARLIQHEVGHLNGELYIDGLERAVKKKALRAIRETL
ncbi:MAG: peptide deformylase [Dermabacter sp.]|nr:peptide deformylase [Dermabacter sp.]